MIIIGYPGIGKSEASKQFIEVIDLESSFITKENGLLSFDGQFNGYCKLAEYLSKQGCVVCVSSHAVVQKLLLRSTEQIYICYPEEELKDFWIHRLRQRYIEDSTDKNYKALERVVEHFDEDIKAMKNSGFDKIELQGGVFLSDVLINSARNQAANNTELEEVDNTGDEPVVEEMAVDDTENIEQE